MNFIRKFLKISNFVQWLQSLKFQHLIETFFQKIRVRLFLRVENRLISFKVKWQLLNTTQSFGVERIFVSLDFKIVVSDSRISDRVRFFRWDLIETIIKPSLMKMK